MSDPKDQLILELLELYKGALRGYLTWWQLSGEKYRGQIPAPELAAAQAKHAGLLEETFREFEKSLARGVPLEAALQALLPRLKTMVR